MDFLAQYGLFALKTFTLVIAILLIFAGIFSLKRKPKPKLEITSLNKEFEQTHTQMQKEIINKQILKEIKKTQKQLTKKEKQESEAKKSTLFVLNFHGDIKASEVDQLRDEISAILSIAKPSDKVLLKLESPGGSVNGYGLAASQLQRIRDHKIPLTVCIDKVAASGGYLMACVADEIVASDFAIIGSIGVVAQIPNFHRWLKNKDIDVELLTAGEYKRTLTMFGENTEKARKKFQEEIEKIHQNFSDYVLHNRSALDMEKVATGEHWLAIDALQLKLVDLLKTSDEYIYEQLDKYNVYLISMPRKESLMHKLLKPAANLMQNLLYQLNNPNKN